MGVFRGCLLILFPFLFAIFFGVFGSFVGTFFSGVMFPGGLVSYGCPCRAVGFPRRAERRIKVRRSFPVLWGFVLMWDSFSYFRSFLVCCGDSLLQFLFVSCGMFSLNLILCFGCLWLVEVDFPLVQGV